MDTKVDLHRFDESIKPILAMLEANPPREGGILFYGSSTMTNWRIDDMCHTQMAPLPITNTGFGGSTAEDALYHYQRLVAPVRPSIIVYYEGANDLKNGYTPEEVMETTHRLFEWARQDFPGVQFVIIPIKLCPGLEPIKKDAERCNELFAHYSARFDDIHLLDVTSLLYDHRGEWRTDVYVEDMLHHNKQGYEELAVLLRPLLERLYTG